MSYSHPRRSSDYGYGIAVAIIVALVLSLIGFFIYEKNKVSYVDFVLNSKDSVSTNSGQGHQYRLYTSTGTYRVGDSLLHGETNSSDLYGRLTPGHEYHCKALGYRFGLTSSFKNVISCQENK